MVLKKMANPPLICAKATMTICNLLLLAYGFILITGGIIALYDSDRVLLSKLLSSSAVPSLNYPLLHYVAIGVASSGLILASTGILGCWASCMHNYWLLSMYCLIIMIVLIGQCAVYAMAWTWPSCLGLDVDSKELTKNLQRNYGAVGQEQFTAAVDLAQSLFHCCGIESANEFDTSLWRLQALGPSLAVPLTCCKLENNNVPRAYLNPRPVNTSLCQALEFNRHEGYRHLQGCHKSLEEWYGEHYLIFLGIGLVAVLIEFSVLLSTIFTCTRIYKYRQGVKENRKNSITALKTAKTGSQDIFRSTPAEENYYHSRDY